MHLAFDQAAVDLHHMREGDELDENLRPVRQAVRRVEGAAER